MAAAEELLRGPLPAPWKYGVTRDGRVFFINDESRSTTWLHPVRNHPIQSGHIYGEDLPRGWEKSITIGGFQYYIDHTNLRTTFQHPVTGLSHAVPINPVGSPGDPINQTESNGSQFQRRNSKKKAKNKVVDKAPSAKRSEDSAISIQGWLQKQESSGLKSWRKRWCVVSDFCFYYYKGSEENQTPVGSILLPSYTISPCVKEDGLNKRFAFKAEHKNMRTVYFAAENENEMSAWINAMSLASVLQRTPRKDMSPLDVPRTQSWKKRLEYWPSSDSPTSPNQVPMQTEPEETDQESGFLPSKGPQDPYGNQGSYNLRREESQRDPPTSYDPSDPQRGGPNDAQRYDPSDGHRYPQNGGPDPYASFRENEDRNSDPPQYNPSSNNTYNNSMRGKHPYEQDSPHSSDPRQQSDPRNSYNGGRDSDPPYGRSDGSSRSPETQRYNDPRDPHGRTSNRNSDPYSSIRRSGPYDNEVSPQNSDTHPRQEERNSDLYSSIRRNAPHSNLDPRYQPRDSWGSSQPEPQRASEDLIRRDQRDPEHTMPKAQDRMSGSGRGSDNDSVRRLQEWTKQEMHRSRPRPPSSNHDSDKPPSDGVRWYGGTRPATQSPPMDPRFSQPLQVDVSHGAPTQTHRSPQDPPLLTSSRDELSAPERPPLPAAYREQYVQDLAEAKTPRTREEILQSEQHSKWRHDQERFFQYPESPPLKDNRKQVDQDEPGAYWRQPQGKSPPASDPYSIDQRAQPQAPTNYMGREGAIQPQRSLAQHSSPRQYLDRSADAVLEHTPWNDSNYIDFNHNMSMPEDPVDAYLRKGAPRKPPRSYADLSPTHWRKLTKLEQENRISKSMGDLRVEEVTAEAVPSSGYPSREHVVPTRAPDPPQMVSKPRVGSPNLSGRNPLGQTPNSRLPPPREIGVIKEDPNMPDSDILTSKTLADLQRHLLGHTRLRLSIAAEDLIGKSHEELVLLLIQLRRSQSSLENARNHFRSKLDSNRPKEKEYKIKRQSSIGRLQDFLEREHEDYIELRKQYEELEKQIEVTDPLVHLLHNMVNMGSLYGGDNLMLSSQYKKDRLQPGSIIPPKRMIEFSRQHQEQQLTQEQEEELRQLVEDETDLEQKLQQLFDLDRQLQEMSLNVTSLEEDKSLLEQAFDRMKQDAANERDPRRVPLIRQQIMHTERELTRSRQDLADASKQLEVTAAENAKVENEVILLRKKIYGLQRSQSTPTLANNTLRNREKIENEITSIQSVMDGLQLQGAKISQVMANLRHSTPDLANENGQQKVGQYMETDLDSGASRDIALHRLTSPKVNDNTGTASRKSRPVTREIPFNESGQPAAFRPYASMPRSASSRGPPTPLEQTPVVMRRGPSERRVNRNSGHKYDTMDSSRSGPYDDPWDLKATVADKQRALEPMRSQADFEPPRDRSSAEVEYVNVRAEPFMNLESQKPAQSHQRSRSHDPLEQPRTEPQHEQRFRDMFYDPRDGSHQRPGNYDPRDSYPKLQETRPHDPRDIYSKPQESRPHDPRDNYPKPQETRPHDSRDSYPKPQETRPHDHRDSYPKPQEMRPHDPRDSYPKPQEMRPHNPRDSYPKPQERRPHDPRDSYSKPQETRPHDPRDSYPKPQETRPHDPRDSYPKPQEMRPHDPRDSYSKPQEMRPHDHRDSYPKPQERRPHDPRDSYSKPQEMRPHDHRDSYPKPQETRPHDPRDSYSKPQEMRPHDPRDSYSKPQEMRPHDPRDNYPKPQMARTLDSRDSYPKPQMARPLDLRDSYPHLQNSQDGSASPQQQRDIHPTYSQHPADYQRKKPTSEVLPQQRAPAVENVRDSYASDAAVDRWADTGSAHEENSDRNNSLTRWRTYSNSGQDMKRWSTDSEKQKPVEEGSYRVNDISDADDNTKRFYGLINKDAQTVQQREADQRMRESSPVSLQPLTVSSLNAAYPKNGHSREQSYDSNSTRHSREELNSQASVRRMSDIFTPRPFGSNCNLASRPVRAFTLSPSLNPEPRVTASNAPQQRSAVQRLSDSPRVPRSTATVHPVMVDQNHNIERKWTSNRPQMLTHTPERTGAVKRKDRKRSLTISSSQPMRYTEQSPRKAIQPHSAAGDLISTKQYEFPDYVKHENARDLEIDDHTIDREVLFMPDKVLIPERYMPESDDEELLTPHERALRQEKAERIRKMLAAHSLQEWRQEEIPGHHGVYGLSDQPVGSIQLHEHVEEEKRRREHILDIKHELARQVTLRSKEVAVRSRSNTWNPHDEMSD